VLEQWGEPFIDGPTLRSPIHYRALGDVGERTTLHLRNRPVQDECDSDDAITVEPPDRFRAPADLHIRPGRQLQEGHRRPRTQPARMLVRTDRANGERAGRHGLRVSGDVEIDHDRRVVGGALALAGLTIHVGVGHRPGERRVAEH